MYIERILCPIVSLGPGKRLVIWTKGCSKNCEGCTSPEMKRVGNTKQIAVDDLFQIIDNIFKEECFDGITISGGDPLEQVDDLVELLKKLHVITDDILVYTGYDWDIYSGQIESGRKKQLMSLISVLIDGPYIQDENIPDLALRGSKNQRILFFDEQKKGLYEEYIKEGRKLQNVYIDDKLITVGIMDK